MPTPTSKVLSQGREGKKASNRKVYLLPDQDTEASSSRSFLSPTFLLSAHHSCILPAPAVLGGLFLEGSITKFYPDYKTTKAGLNKFVKSFSWPEGFPSHVNAETPGSSSTFLPPVIPNAKLIVGAVIFVI